MQLQTLLSKHTKEVFYGKNWTWVNMKDCINDISWEEATKEFSFCNTIATLVFHIQYYIDPLQDVLQGKPLKGNDSDSFAAPQFENEASWLQFKNELFAKIDILITHINTLSDEDMDKIFAEEKYGTVARNILGFIEHTHYHLGQIALIKKMIRQH